MSAFFRSIVGVCALSAALFAQNPITESGAKLVTPINPLYLYAHFRDNDTVHLRLSYSSTALDWLDTAFRLKDPGFAWMKVDALMNPLRSEPRFQAIEAKLKFPP